MIGMMKLILFSLIIMSLHAGAQSICKAPVGVTPVDPEVTKSLSDIRKCVRNQFKRRAVYPAGFTLALNIETNFNIPFVGKDPYFGRVYFSPGKDEIKYRDEKISQDNLTKEQKKPSSIYLSSYKLSDMNSDKGLSLVNGGGAEVVLSSPTHNFSSTTGGRVAAKVKGPNGKALRFIIDIELSKGKAQNYVINNGKRIPFDTIKVNAKGGFMGVSILNGVQNIQFIKSGKVLATTTE